MIQSLPVLETCYLGFGSNIGNRIEVIREALSQLKKHPKVHLIKSSSFYETAPWGEVNQEKFINLCVKIKTDLSPKELLDFCLSVEKKLGRKRLIKWGARTIDIDILLYGDKELHEDSLTIPHPYMLERAFVLIPLHQLSPNLICNGRPITQWIQDQPSEALLGIKKIEDLENF